MSRPLDEDILENLVDFVVCTTSILGAMIPEECRRDRKEVDRLTRNSVKARCGRRENLPRYLLAWYI